MTGGAGTPKLFFVTPVWRRFLLSKICLEQRARMIERLPFEAECVVIGDDENLEVARELGFHTVELDNDYVGRKWNAGYKYAYENGATHCMPIGSDSFLHESAFEGAEFIDHKGLALVGLSSFSPTGNERLDLRVRYPAGFGVGMIYPSDVVYAKRQGFAACDPRRQKGCDNSTWARVGRGRVQLEFLEYRPHVYCNFHSNDESITDFRLVARVNGRIVERDSKDPLSILRANYDADLVEELETLYALRSLQWLLSGPPEEFTNPNGRPSKRSYPGIGKRGAPRRKEGMVARRYGQVAKRGVRDNYEGLQAAKDRGQVLSRDEEMILRFDAARGY